jgi:molybdopterin synthase sulfur carrier subunit
MLGGGKPGTGGMIKVLYFGHLMEAFGMGSEQIEASDALRNISDLIALLAQRGDIWQQALVDNRALKITVNKQFVALDSALKDGDEVAFVAFMVS